ncbi:hypothetical protein TNCV_4370721 [Trichonephila clavipes]|uniref:Uncharacterized protein n=1 Tax=Trichonephila clavipes TaxID=2585209 RepID=A0A8X6S698_TRICX|nr:hypothetical protein TNCV_4370721 [Trichonephila clavipes]
MFPLQAEGLPSGRGDTRFYPLPQWAAQSRHRHPCSATQAHYGLHLSSVLTDDVVSRAFIQYSALEQVVAIHSGTDAAWVDLISCQAKPVEVYSQSVMSSGSRVLPVETTRLPAWHFGWLSHYRGSQHNLGLTRHDLPATREIKVVRPTSSSNQSRQTHVTQHHQLIATTHTLAIANISFIHLSTDSLLGEYFKDIFSGSESDSTLCTIGSHCDSKINDCFESLVSESECSGDGSVLSVTCDDGTLHLML